MKFFKGIPGLKNVDFYSFEWSVLKLIKKKKKKASFNQRNFIQKK